jgi:predicted ATP-binding protein involved in virulence
MRIKRLEIKNLFGVFNHEIPINTEDRITIIYGPNGFGKTYILVLLNALFNSIYNEFFRVPFSEYIVEFTDGGILRLMRHKNGDGQVLETEYLDNLGKTEKFQFERVSDREDYFRLPFIINKIPGLEKIGTDSWHYLPTNEVLNLSDIVSRFRNYFLDAPLSKKMESREPLWLTELKKSVGIRFIRTERLVRMPESSAITGQTSVAYYADFLKEKIQEKLAEYAELSQSLDRTFPLRLAKGLGTKKMTPAALGEKLKNLEEKRKKLSESGLLEKEEIDLSELGEINEKNSNVLAVYISDAEKKLGIFDELSEKIELLMKMVNSRFLHKKMEISKRDGFFFRTSDNSVLNPEKLSSGEQQVVVLFCELLFNVPKDSLVLIDEPELSLHVVWQQNFLSDLGEIIKLADFDILIATHSPQIIHDRWDLAVELKDPRE